MFKYKYWDEKLNSSSLLPNWCLCKITDPKQNSWLHSGLLPVPCSSQVIYHCPNASWIPSLLHTFHLASVSVLSQALTISLLDSLPIHLSLFFFTMSFPSNSSSALLPKWFFWKRGLITLLCLKLSKEFSLTSGLSTNPQWDVLKQNIWNSQPLPCPFKSWVGYPSSIFP